MLVVVVARPVVAREGDLPDDFTSIARCSWQGRRLDYRTSERGSQGVEVRQSGTWRTTGHRAVVL
jgi:hypothetical protein